MRLARLDRTAIPRERGGEERRNGIAFSPLRSFPPPVSLLSFIVSWSAVRPSASVRVRPTADIQRQLPTAAVLTEVISFMAECRQSAS